MRRRHRGRAIALACVITAVVYMPILGPAWRRLLPDPIEDWAILIGLGLCLAIASLVAWKFCNRY